jgi:hypothetical protein
MSSPSLVGDHANIQTNINYNPVGKISTIIGDRRDGMPESKKGYL